MLEIKYRDAAGRVCRWDIGKHSITTPNIAVVINPSKMTIPPKELKKKFGVEIIITNAYILKNSKDSKEIENVGLHKFLDWSGPIYTDSGTFQMYSKGKVNITPDETIDYQKKIGSDIITPLDLFTLPEDKRDVAKSKLEETAKRVADARKNVDANKSLLVGPVQGGSFEELRSLAAKEISNASPDVFAVGGIVPLMEQYRYADLVNAVIAVRKNILLDRPLHAFGAGHPMVFSLLASIGVDLFDSAAYAIYAANGRYLMPDGTRHINEMEELPCSCPVCSTSKPKDLDEGLLARHNLYVTMSEIKAIREAIHEGALYEFVEQRIRAHPALIGGYIASLSHNNYLERFDPIAKKGAFFYTCPESAQRPSVHRYKSRLSERYAPPKGKKCIILNAFNKNIHSTRSTHFCLVQSPFGIVPSELSNLYPMGHVLSSGKDYEDMLDSNDKSIKSYISLGKHFYSKISILNPKSGKIEIGNIEKEDADPLLEIRSTIMYQFGKDASKIFDNIDENPDISLEISRSTKRIRRVFKGKSLLGTIRANDGFFIPSYFGASLVKEHLDYPKYRVVVSEDAVPFVKEGKSVFSKFVKDADPDIRPYDEVFVVDSKDNLLATGRALLNREEMLAFKTGISVKVRDVKK